MDFNPRSHKGSDPRHSPTGLMWQKFQSTLPQGERHISPCHSAKMLLFQSTLPQGERQNTTVQEDISDIISIHAPTRGATLCSTGTLFIYGFQSTLPQGERRSPLVFSSNITSISIHAPTRGATRQRWYRRCPPYFNPRSHKGSDCSSQKNRSSQSYFNPRSHKGSDREELDKIAEKGLFQSTLPQGERPRGRNHSLNSFLDFNPRSHKGSDRFMVTVRKTTVISIHAPTRGATEAMQSKASKYTEFQSTLPQGERQQFYTKFHICFISFLPILSPYHISTHSPLPTFNHFLYIFSGANRPEISCLLPFRTKTISGIL